MLKIKDTQTTEEALVDTLKTGYNTAFVALKNILYLWAENVFTKMILKFTFTDLFTGNLEWWRQASDFIKSFTQKFLNSRTSTHLLTTFVKKRTNNSMD